MTALEQNPTQKNFLPGNNFKFLMRRAPNVQWFCQTVNLPNLLAPETKEPNPFMGRHMPGGAVDHESLMISFKVAEDMANYLEIFNWLIAITDSKDFDGYRILHAEPPYSDKGLRSEIVVTVLNSNKQPAFEIVYHDCFPVDLYGWTFDTTLTDTDYPICRARFEYQYFEINPIT